MPTLPAPSPSEKGDSTGSSPGGGYSQRVTTSPKKVFEGRGHVHQLFRQKTQTVIKKTVRVLNIEGLGSCTLIENVSTKEENARL